ncbi:unnamed protein product [Thlaspi arvense]|uniref:RRM domain-containing protein n=1 Tax=Thlaspi arvense TaxID=13288 RepID=A0AAU9RZ91_THLAR|nr:unnamed protein product [Thlaspi arvense]
MEKYGPKGQSKPYNGSPENPNDNSIQQLDFDMSLRLSNCPSWVCRTFFEYYLFGCSLCNSKSTCEHDFLAHVRGKKHRENAKGFDAKKRKQFEQPMIHKGNSNLLPDFDITVGLSNQSPWFCRYIFHLSFHFHSIGHALNGIYFGSSLCNIKASCRQNLLSHAIGNKHQANLKLFDAEQQQQRQSEHSKKDNSKQQINVDVNVGLSNCYPWFCSKLVAAIKGSHIFGWFLRYLGRAQSPKLVVLCLCNMKATSQQCLLSHGNGRKHRENVEWFNATQLHSERSTMETKDTIENASNGDSEQKKVDRHVSSGVANGYSKAGKKRKLETFDETSNGEVVQAEEAEGRVEKKSKSKKAKKQDDEKKAKTKQTESDSDFEHEKEDMKLLLISYSKEELVNLVYKTAEKGSRLMSAILKSADRDISQRNIFVRGFGWETTEEYLKAAFESYGEVEKCSVVMDKDTGRSKRYGFVVFKTRKGAREALKIPEKRMYNRTVVCNLASAKPCGAGNRHEVVEPVKIELTQMANQSEVALPGLDLAHEHVLKQRQQQPYMEMFGPNMPFYGHSQPPSFDPMYGALWGNQMVAGLPNYSMFGSGLMNQGSLVAPNHVGMAGQYFGDDQGTWYI